MKVLYSQYTDAGGRENNEDAVAVAVAEHGHLFVVADGLGGHDDGEKASRIAVEEIKRRFLEDGERFDPENAVCAANGLILERQKIEGSSMRTTVALAWVGKSLTRFAHVGDSRIYALDKEGIVYQSPDHSVSQMAVERGEISLDGIRGHCDRNKLTGALGADEKVSVCLNAVKNREYDGLLLCTDGFWEYVYESEMISLFGEAQVPNVWIEKMHRLHAARVDGSHDNNTALAVIIDGGNPDAEELSITKTFTAQPFARYPAQLARGGATPKSYKGKYVATVKKWLLVLLAAFLLLAFGYGAYRLFEKSMDTGGAQPSAEISVEDIF